MWKEISKFGKKLVDYGLAGAHFGNISVRVGNKILITRSGVMLDELDEKAVIRADLNKPVPSESRASAETLVHQVIYQKTRAQAIIHAHSPFAIVQSMVVKSKLLACEDCESKYFLKGIPIVSGEPGSRELAQKSAQALKNHRGVIVRGHGTFGVGKDLKEAYLTVSSIEQSCKIKYFADLVSSFKR